MMWINQLGYDWARDKFAFFNVHWTWKRFLHYKDLYNEIKKTAYVS